MKRDLWLGDNNTVFWGYTGQWWSALNETHINDVWSETNPNAYFPVPTNTTRSRQIQTKYLQDASYIRLKDLTIGYTLPTSWVSKLGISQLKVSQVDKTYGKLPACINIWIQTQQAIQKMMVAWKKE